MAGLAPLAAVTLHNRSKATCESQNGFCPSWIKDHIGDYVDPLVRHAELTLAAVACGFAIALLLALLAREQRWLVGPIIAATGAMYVIPSLALFGLLLPITGFGFVTALIALTSYTLLILFRNIVTGLDGVPSEARDAAQGMGLTDRQLLFKVELPLALPAIFAGLRIATATTVGLASLAFFAGAGGLGEQINTDINFKSNVAVAGALCILLAFAFELALLSAQRLAIPWTRTARAR
jgi:osmoprotectant transport system permease protein